MTHSIAVFISPHGFGHAARAGALMESIRRIIPSVGFEIFTTVPAWFFRETLSDGFHYHPMPVDIGLRQQTPFQEDLKQTVEDLKDLFPFDPAKIRAVAQILMDRGCRLILCDISPMGIAVGKAAGIPAVLVENFTWDWIYHGYLGIEPGFASVIDLLGPLFESAEYRIQTEPVCRPYARADLTVSPMSRNPRRPPDEIRAALGIPQGHRMVHVTMGGIPREYSMQERFRGIADTTVVISGGGQSPKQEGNVVELPHHTSFYHPDLIGAADLVVGKVGYSTLAEVFDAGVPFLYVTRPVFRESRVLGEFIQSRMHGRGITAEAFEEGRWLEDLAELFALPRVRRSGTPGARQAAEFVCRLI